MRAIFFLGSGVSFKTGLPDTIEITNRILNGKWHNHTDENFYEGDHPSPYYHSRNLVPRLQKFLKILKKASDNYLKERRNIKTTYEDLFYLSQQISDNEQYEIDNPAIASFVEKIRINPSLTVNGCFWGIF